MEITVQQVSALAPDASALAAGRKLATAKDWRSTGHDQRSLWGECQGSALYQVKVDLAALAYNCTCPSRKLPCKHVLGLLLLAAGGGQVVAAESPEWVTTWLAKRSETAKKKEEKRQAVDTNPVDAEAQAKRAVKRYANVGDGIAQLELWMTDLVRGGLAELDCTGVAFWQDQARRLVDAQAKGLATRVEKLGELVGTGSDWPARLLAELGLLALLTQAYGRLAQLDAPLAADVRQLIGWTVDEKELRAGGDVTSDRWLVLGQSLEEEDRLRVQRNWLLGLSTGRTALVLQFAFDKGPFPAAILPATVIEGEVAFYASAYPQRGQIVERAGDQPSFTGRLAASTIADMLSTAADALARQPWLDRTVALLAEARVVPAKEAAWQICDAASQAVPLVRGSHWTLLALSGGRPLTIAGLWNGAALEPLGAMVDGTYLALAGTAR
jgi:hypothetical protein